LSGGGRGERSARHTGAHRVRWHAICVWGVMPKPRVLLADDEVLFLGGLEQLLAAECDIVGSISDGRTLVTEAVRLQPDIILLDVAMPLLNGLEAAHQIKQILPAVRVMFVTRNEEPAVVAKAFRIGTSAYLLKRCPASELMAAFREVAQGRAYVTPLVAGGLIDSLLHGDRADDVGLTHRQREVLQLLAEGHSMKEAGALLNVTPRTVAFHKNQMKAQLNLHSTAALIGYAIKHHLV
jgi:DNA-binding NarL/FixJ family response regulator